MPDEQTPLIQTIRIAPVRQRYTHSTFRRFCTISLASILIIVVILFLSPLRLPQHGGHQHGRPAGPWPDRPDPPEPDSSQKPSQPETWPQSDRLSYEKLQEVLISTPKEEKAREWSQYYTAGPHLAGKNSSQAKWTKERWQEFGIQDVNIVPYHVYINYPLGHRLALLDTTAGVHERRLEDDDAEVGEIAQDTVKYECILEEEVLEQDSTSGLPDRVPTFHGYSASGNVTAQYVYVNFGTYQDFDDLIKANIPLSGKIALVKYGRIFRGLKVKRAQELGMVGVVMYTDPQEDGEITEENGYETYPHGPARNPSSVQRGSTQFLSIAPGDPTTPGYPSKPGVPRQDPHHAIPSIPSLPISYVDALPLLHALTGHGPNASSFNKYWQGGGLAYKNVTYNIGPSPPSNVLNLVNKQEYVTNPLWNVIGIINGTTNPEEVLILGNHRDAWIAGGAGDPNSGSAAMNEVVRSFGIALSSGWKPLRTIVFASWDGEEYGLIGSTEWVEEYLPWLSVTTIAYLNVDVGTRGPNFQTAASPLLNKAIFEATGLVPSPNQTLKGQTVRDLWNGHISTMGSGSDFTAFQDYAGIPSVDLGFGGDAKSAVYHYHSNYDSFAWMERFGDVGWEYHIAITKVWALMAAYLSESPVIPFSATDYADALAGYLKGVEDKARKQKAVATTNQDMEAEREEEDGARESTTHTVFEPLAQSIAKLKDAAKTVDNHATSLLKSHLAPPSSVPSWWKSLFSTLFSNPNPNSNFDSDTNPNPNPNPTPLAAINNKYKLLERQFLHPKGLDGRPWFKHVVFAPGVWTGYSGAVFPGIVEALEREGDEEGVRRWVGIVKGCVDSAVGLLEG